MELKKSNTTATRPDSKSSQRSTSPSSKMLSSSSTTKTTTASSSLNKDNPSSLIKKKVIRNEKEVDRAYPFTDAEKSTFDRLVSSAEILFKVKDLVERHNHEDHSNMNESVVFETITVGLNFIRENCHMSFNSKQFADCMGNGGEGVCYAFAYDFKHLMSIELSEDSYNLAKARSRQFNGLSQRLELNAGSLQNYFPIDYDIYFLDTTILRCSMIDEGPLIKMFFDLIGRRCIAGVYIILVSATTDLHPHNDFEAHHLRRLFTSKKLVGTANECLVSVFMTEITTAVREYLGIDENNKVIRK
jgi:hypothetical protein